MADWPANGAENWNTLMLAYLAVEHNTDGTHDVETILTDAQGPYFYANVDASATKVYVKYFTGTLDGDSSTDVAHGITGIDNILTVNVAVFSTNSNTYKCGGQNEVASATIAFQYQYDGTNVTINGVGSTVQSQKYRIKIDYIL